MSAPNTKQGETGQPAALSYDSSEYVFDRASPYGSNAGLYKSLFNEYVTSLYDTYKRYHESKSEQQLRTNLSTLFARFFVTPFTWNGEVVDVEARVDRLAKHMMRHTERQPPTVELLVGESHRMGTRGLGTVAARVKHLWEGGGGHAHFFAEFVDLPGSGSFISRMWVLMKPFAQAEAVEMKKEEE